MPGYATTGLTSEQFDELLDRLAAHVEWDCGWGRPRALTLRQATTATLVYFRRNLAQEVIGELLGADQATVSRAIAALEGPIAAVLHEFVPDLPAHVHGRVGVVDGSLCPCWSWADKPELYSGKHHTTGHGHQFVVDLAGELLHVSEPTPGRTHDARAIRDTGTLALLDPANTIGDRGYLGTGLLTPWRKPPGGALLEWQKEFNTALNKLRYVAERAIANYKTWRIMHTDYRRPEHTYTKAFHAVRALHFFKMTFA